MPRPFADRWRLCFGDQMPKRALVNRLACGESRGTRHRRTQSSGSVIMTKRQDLTGRVFGRWLVEGPGPLSKHQAMTWMCLCKCGTRRAVLAYQLFQNKSLSCGCHMSDMCSVRTIKDETGNIYGYWTVLQFCHVENRTARWLCECGCGTRRIVSGVSLRRGESNSCGHCSWRGRGRRKAEATASSATPPSDPLWAMDKNEGD